MHSWSVRFYRPLAGTIVSLAFLFLLAAVGARAADWDEDESVDGDLSNNRLAPSSFPLTAGTNSLFATMNGSDLDYVTLVIPADHQLTGITPASYASTDGTSFIGMQAGTQVTTTGSASVLLGYAHFGTTPNNIGQNILPAMCMGAGAIGCTPPLDSGSYSLWIQQASTVDVTYQFDFDVTGPSGVPGDYNGDNSVNAADYTVYRNALAGIGGTTLINEGETPGVVTIEDYQFWKDHYGDGLGSGSAFAGGAVGVPEPATIVLLGLGAAAILTLPRQRSRFSRR